MDNLSDHFKGGRPAVIFDGEEREGECDLVFYPERISWEHIRFMRIYAGGLICLALSEKHCDNLGIGFFSDLLSEHYPNLKCGKMPYGDEPSFSLPVNHKNVFTGISDEDRALTVSRLFEIVKSREYALFRKEFVSPGHLFLLRARQGRRGHTELSVSLMESLGLDGVALISEMLGDDGKKLPVSRARRFAEMLGIPFIRGDDL